MTDVIKSISHSLSYQYQMIFQNNTVFAVLIIVNNIVFKNVAIQMERPPTFIKTAS